mgnify:CR=1 FL=1
MPLSGNDEKEFRPCIINDVGEDAFIYHERDCVVVAEQEPESNIVIFRDTNGKVVGVRIEGISLLPTYTSRPED